MITFYRNRASTQTVLLRLSRFFNFILSFVGTYLTLRKNQWSFYTCYSADEQIVSNIPIENTRQTCGNLISPYICRGVFTNSTFTYRYGDSYSIQIDVSAIKQFSHDLILFEFGIFNGAVERQILEGPIFSVFLCMEFDVLNAKREVAVSLILRVNSYNTKPF